MKDYKAHELSNIIPLMTDAEYQGLKNKIKEHGFQEKRPIFLYENKILDGRHRYQACKELGVEAKIEEFKGDTRTSALDFVILSNIDRRNLSPTQCAACAYEALPIYQSEAKKRQQLSEGRGKKGTQKIEYLKEDQGEAVEHAAKMFNANRQYIYDIQKMAKELSQKKFDTIFEGLKKDELSVSQARRELKKEKREAQRNEDRKTLKDIPDIKEALGKVKFPTITIDPPWDWGDEGDDDQLGRARPDYATMPFEEILKFPVADFADKDCHIYLWITNRSLPKGFALLEEWGFRYITCITWCKPSFGMGNYFRGASEHILFGVKGSQPLKRKNATTWFQAKRGPKHGKSGYSSKPEEFYQLVESCSPGPYLEIFARTQKEKRRDWTQWGNENG